MGPAPYPAGDNVPHPLLRFAAVLTFSSFSQQCSHFADQIERARADDIALRPGEAARFLQRILHMRAGIGAKPLRFKRFSQLVRRHGTGIFGWVQTTQRTREASR